MFTKNHTAKILVGIGVDFAETYTSLQVHGHVKTRNKVGTISPGSGEQSCLMRTALSWVITQQVAVISYKL
jgi:hypothetical protein